MFGLRMGAMGRVGAGLTLTQQAINILRRPGLESHAFISGVGWVNGLSLTNAIMEDGTQAASVDNPMGYMGDPIATVGAELVTNGDFSVDANWTKGTGWTISGGVATHAAGATSELTQSLSLTAGRSYQITYTISGYSGSGGVSPRFNGGTVASASALTANGTYTQIITAVTGNNTLAFNVVSTATLSIDNVSVKELVGAIPARQATTANKPILRRGHVNRIRNSTMVGAVAGTPGTAPTNWLYGSGAGITRSIVGTGTADGLAYVDVRFSGTASATADAQFDPESFTNIASGLGLTWTYGITLALVAGSWPVRPVNVRIYERASGGGSLGTPTDLDVRSLVTGATLTRVSVSRTTNQATVAFVQPGIRCPIQSGDVVDFTVRIAAPQLEQGSVANTFVPTTTAAASSPTGPFWAEFDGTDFLSLAAVPFQLQDDFFVIAAASPYAIDSNRRVFAITSAGSAQFRLYIDAASGGDVYAAYIDDTGASVVPVTPGKLPVGALKVVGARKVGSAKTNWMNGVAASANNTAQGVSTFTSPQLGANGTGGANFIGQLGIVLIGKGSVTDGEMAFLMRYVAASSGVTL